MTYEEAIQAGILTDLKPKSAHEEEMKKLYPHNKEDFRDGDCPYCTGPDDMCNC